MSRQYWMLPEVEQAEIAWQEFLYRRRSLPGAGEASFISRKYQVTKLAVDNPPKQTMELYTFKPVHFWTGQGHNIPDIPVNYQTTTYRLYRFSDDSFVYVEE
jgi:hypothetical protein